MFKKLKQNSPWVKCETCQEEWQPQALLNGKCPRCRGLLPKQAISEAMEMLIKKTEELEKLNLSIEELSLALSNYAKEHNLLEDKSKLLKCSNCNCYDLTMNIIEGKYICDVCYKIYKTIN